MKLVFSSGGAGYLKRKEKEKERKKKKREGRKRGRELRVNLEIPIWLPQLPWSLWQATQPPTCKLCQCPHLQHVNNTSLKAYQHPVFWISLLMLHGWPAKVRRKACDFTRSEKITVKTIGTIIHCEWSNARMTFKWDTHSSSESCYQKISEEDYLWNVVVQEWPLNCADDSSAQVSATVLSKEYTETALLNCISKDASS